MPKLEKLPSFLDFANRAAVEGIEEFAKRGTTIVNILGGFEEEVLTPEDVIEGIRKDLSTEEFLGTFKDREKAIEVEAKVISAEDADWRLEPHEFEQCCREAHGECCMICHGLKADPQHIK